MAIDDDMLAVDSLDIEDEMLFAEFPGSSDLEDTDEVNLSLLSEPSQD